MLDIYRWFLLILFLIFGTNVFARQTETGGFSLDTRKDRAVKFDFEYYNNLVVVPVLINGSRDSLKMILDTGVARTLITGLPNNEEIELSFTEVIRIAGLGQGESIEAFYSHGNEIDIDRATGLNQEVLVLREDIFHLSTFLGTYVHGLIGYNVFQDFIVEIDYSRGWIKFHSHDRFGGRYQKKKNSNDWSSLPLTFRNEKPYVDVEVLQQDGTRAKLNLLIDSGASHGLALYHSANDSIHLPEHHIRSFLGNGLSGEILGAISKVEELNFGGHIFEDVIASYPDEEGIRRAIIYSSRDGSIGSEILKRFKIMYNYRDSTMIFRPSKYYDEPFHYNTSGLEIITPFPNIKLYEIAHVRPGSVSEKSGIQKGDFITEINGVTSSRYSLNETLDILQGEPGQRVSLKIVRQDSSFRVNLNLINELE
jgi:hypothetical protein